MKKAGNLYVPDGDVYFAAGFARSGDRFEHDNLLAAMAACRQRRIAVDGGAHVGSWSRTMAETFSKVLAFEPHQANYECLRRNVPTNVETIPCALGPAFGVAGMATDSPENSGAGYMAEGADVIMVPLDVLGIDGLDLFKLDVEGFELFALQGAERTIERCKPVVMVEQKEQTARWCAWDAAGAWLVSRGYRLHKVMRRDHIYVPM